MTSAAELRLAELQLELPLAMQLPAGVELPFEFVRIVGDRAIISGHVPQQADGALAGPFGKVGKDVDLAGGQLAARAATLAMLGSLKRELGDLGRIKAWVKVFGMVNAAPDFNRLPAVINACSEIILDVFGPEIGAHARSAVGVAALPFDVAVEIEAEVQISL